MLTIGEENAVRDLKRSANTFLTMILRLSTYLEATEKLIRLEAMKAKNLESPGFYSEEDFLKLL